MSTIAKGNNVIDLGPTGEAIARNIKALRETLGLSYAALEQQTLANGRRIPAISIRRIEGNARRVDIDELMVLAFTLKSSPTELLTDHESGSATGVRAGDYVKEEIEAWIGGRIDSLEARELMPFWRDRIDLLQRRLTTEEARLRETMSSGASELGLLQLRIQNRKEKLSYAQDRLTHWEFSTESW